MVISNNLFAGWECKFSFLLPAVVKNLYRGKKILPVLPVTCMLFTSIFSVWVRLVLFELICKTSSFFTFSTVTMWLK